jgi:antitoxin component YwqK of YwqJK toxin-antitoxin module
MKDCKIKIDGNIERRYDKETNDLRKEIDYWDNGNKHYEEHTVYGKRHREDGPAWQKWYENGTKKYEEYYLNGKKYSKEDWLKKVK